MYVYNTIGLFYIFNIKLKKSRIFIIIKKETEKVRFQFYSNILRYIIITLLFNEHPIEFLSSALRNNFIIYTFN